MHAMLAFALAILLSVAATTGAAAKRVALVVGNAAYKNAPQLTNPRNDATDLAAAFRSLGFTVVDGFDLDKAAFDRRVRDFATALIGAELGVFFYAGHGLQIDGQNYLVPTDAKADSGAALDFEMIRLDLVQRTMEREAKTNVLFLDACRDNPLARNLARALGTRSSAVGRGLASAESGAGTLISFATQPGNVALDGEGRNSPFAGALAGQLKQSTEDLSTILIAVRGEVMRATQGRQVPWEHSALTGRVFFRAGVSQPGPPPATKGQTGNVGLSPPAALAATTAPPPQPLPPGTLTPPAAPRDGQSSPPALAGTTHFCGYNSGPKFGRIEKFNFAPMIVGGPCHDGRGNVGVAIAEPRPDDWARLRLDPKLWSHTCRYSGGPKTGQIERYPQFGATNVGTFCNDGFGSVGVVIPES